jgi:hypothetical protein
MQLARAGLVLFSLYALVSPSMAQPTFNSGGYMLPHCKNLAEMDAAPGIWEGQCAGVIEGFMLLGDLLPRHLRFCPPDGMPPIAADLIVIKYLDDHPEDLHLDFRLLALAALHKAWPCPSSSRSK